MHMHMHMHMHVHVCAYRAACTWQVAYFDYDGFPLRNMDEIFDECGGAPFCAVADTMTPINPKYRGRYLNGGVLVLRPNVTTYEHLLREAKVDARSRRARWYAEQGFLNHVFAGQWADIGFVHNANLAIYGGTKSGGSEEGGVRVGGVELLFPKV